MRRKLAILSACFVFTLAMQPAMAATNYPFVSSFGGHGLVKTGAFSFPQYVAVDEAGNVYVTDLGNFRVQKFDNDGEFLHSWGSKGTDSKNFQAPAGIAVKNNFVYVVDHELNVVKKFDTTGNFISLWGSTGTDPGKFKLPNGVAVSKDDFVYVVDTGNSRVQKFDSEGKYIKTIGSSGTEQGKFLNPLGIAVDNDENIYVGDAGNKRIQKFTAEGTFVKSYTASSGGIQISPDGVAVDSSGNIMIADAGNNRVVVLNKEGSVLTTFGTTGTANGQFKLSKDVAVDSDGDLFVVDSSNHRIQKFGSKDTTKTTQTQTEAQTTKPIPNDFKKPEVIPPKDLYVEATGGLTKVSIGMAMAHDESGIKSITSNAPVEFPLGITTVIWTAIDNAGNVGIATQTITVGDSTPPVFSNLSDIIVEAKGAQNEIDLGTPIVTDIVGVLSVTNDAPATFPLGETIVTWTATDVAKNTATAIQKVTVRDTTPPKIKAPANISAEASSLDGNNVNLGEPNVSDNSEIASITNDAPAAFPLGETIVTWNAVDVAGNISTATQKVNIVDTTKPVIAQPPEIVVEAVSATGTPVTLDNPIVSDVQAVTITNDAPELFPLGSTQVAWLAVDGSGNNATVTQSVTVVDTTPPNLTVPADITQEATGLTGNIVALGEPLVDDITGISSISNNAPSDYPFGTTIITWTATDNYGNSISKNQTVTIIDTTKPEITPPKDVVVEASSISENVVTLGEPKVSDLVEINSITHDAPSAFSLGQTTVTWTVTDSSGNIATATQLISVIDTTAPAITVPENIVAEATGGSGTSVAIGEATATDAIGVDSITNDSPGIFNLGTTLVTWSATDTSGNVATAIQNVTVVDTTPPTITAPADITIEATSADSNQVTLGDAAASDAVSLLAVTNDAPSVFPLGETIVTWTATDEAGNSASATQVITIVDTTPPTITAPADITAEATSKLDNTVTLETPSVSDNVGVASITNDAPEKFPVGETIVTWTATDVSGLSTQIQQKVTITDTTKPEIYVSNISVEATSEDKNAVDLGSVDATDLVEITSITNDAPDTFALGETIVTWTATDEAGNSASATQVITIVDTTPPTITAPADITIEATSADSNQVTLGDAAASDAVSLLAVTNDAPSVFPLGETIVTWTATDEAGNSASATQVITIVDTTPPTITAPADITAEATSKLDNTVTLETPSVSDNVGVASITNDAPEKFPVGETIVTWTATDQAGNMQTISQKVVIVDTVPPEFVKLDQVIVEATGVENNQITLELPQVSDILDITSITNDAPDTFALGETIVTWTATDEAGNSASATQVITVVDTTAPKLTIPQDIVIDAIALETPVFVGTATAFDLTDPLPQITHNAPSIFPLGETIVTWTAVDKYGNSINQTQSITVQACGKPHTSYNLILGTEEDDVLIGTTLADLIFGFGGDDIIIGDKGNDCIFGGDGDDIIYGNEGDDTIYGGSGADIIKGGSGQDVLDGGPGTDIIDGGDDNDTCIVSEKDGDMAVSCESLQHVETRQE